MCREYADLEYLRRETEERMKEASRKPAPPPTPAAAPAGGLVAVLRGLLEKVRLAKSTVPAE